MEDVLQKKIGVKVDITTVNQDIKINLEGSENNFFVKLDDLKLNTKIVEIDSLEIKKNNVVMGFKAPIICNNNNVDDTRSMLVGVDFNGVDKDVFITKIEETARSFGPEWENAVLRRKQLIEQRTIKNK